MFYAPEDILRIASVAVDDVERCSDGSTRLKVISMLKYCQSRQCRRALFARSLLDHYEPELSNATKCGTMKQVCDNCQRSHLPHSISSHMISEIRSVITGVEEIISRGSSEDSAGSLTMKRITTSPIIKRILKSCTELNGTSDVEYITAGMLAEAALGIHFNFTPYATHCYFKKGPKFKRYRFDDPKFLDVFYLASPNSVNSLCDGSLVVPVIESGGSKRNIHIAEDTKEGLGYRPTAKRLKKQGATLNSETISQRVSGVEPTASDSTAQLHENGVIDLT